jgi:nucleoside-diphosphate-sugar epimerase
VLRAVPLAFVTGGSGYVGGRLIERLAGDGWSMRALARSDRAADGVRVRGAERFVAWLASREGTLDDTRARAELGYAPVVSREQGMRDLRDAVMPP